MFIPQIVPTDLFNKVQDRLKKNTKAAARHKAKDDYLLTTKLFCGKCGANMAGESGTGRNGEVHRYYKCNTAKYKHACDKKTVQKDWIENLVIKYTREVMNDEVIEDIAGIVFRNFQRENPAIQLLKQRLNETETALNNLLTAIEEGIITSTTKQRMLALEQTRDEINLKLIKEEMKKPTITKEGLVLWLKQIQTMRLETKEHKQRLIDIFVNAVYLYDDKLIITFNYKEASKTVTLKEVNGSIIECAGVPIKDAVDDTIHCVFYLCNGGRDSNNQIAICRWHIAATSSKTGCYLNFCPSPARAKMQTSPTIRTK